MCDDVIFCEVKVDKECANMPTQKYTVMASEHFNIYM